MRLRDPASLAPRQGDVLGPAGQAHTAPAQHLDDLHQRQGLLAAALLQLAAHALALIGADNYLGLPL